MNNKKSQATAGAWDWIVYTLAALLVLLVIVFAWPAIQRGFNKAVLFVANLL